MKIMIVTPYFYPKIGGLESYALNIALGLKKAGHDVFVVTTNHEEKKHVEQKVKGLRVIRLPISYKFSNTPFSFGWRRQLKRIIQTEKPDIINAHTPVPGLSDIAIRVGSRLNTKTALTYHAATLKKTGSVLFNIVALIYGIYQKQTFKKATALIAVSDYVKDCLPKKYQDKTTVIYNAVDTADIPTRKVSRHANRLIFVGSLDRSHAWKGLSDILKAVQIVKKSNSKIELQVIGDGDMRNEYEEQAVTLGIQKNVKFNGFVIGVEKYKLIQSASAIIVYPTTENDAFPTVFLEAWACDTAIIASSIGAIRFIINQGVNGELVSPSSPVQLAKLIIDLLPDKERLEKLTLVGRNEIKNTYNVNNICKLYADELINVTQVRSNNEYLKSSNNHNICIYADTLQAMGGAERAVILFANRIGADIITSGYNPLLSDWEPIHQNVIDIGNQSYNWNKSFSCTIEAPIRFFMRRRTHDDYRVYIYSGISSIFASTKDKNSYWYCHTPNRLLYDLREYNLKSSGILKKLALRVYQTIFVYLDKRVILNNINHIIVNSETVKDRVNKYYGRDSTVIYPPIDTYKYRYECIGDFYLCVSRLTPEKRVDVIIKAFRKLPMEKLVIVGDGPLAKVLLNQIPENVKLVRNAGQEELIRLYAECKAVIYIPLNEDFGMVPVEAMASGKLCIGSNEGGCKETILAGVTGSLIDGSEEAVIKAVNRFSIKDARAAKDKCIKRARLFDTEESARKLRNLIESGIRDAF